MSLTCGLLYSKKEVTYFLTLRKKIQSIVTTKSKKEQYSTLYIKILASWIYYILLRSNFQGNIEYLQGCASQLPLSLVVTTDTRMLTIMGPLLNLGCTCTSSHSWPIIPTMTLPHGLRPEFLKMTTEIIGDLSKPSLWVFHSVSLSSSPMEHSSNPIRR